MRKFQRHALGLLLSLVLVLAYVRSGYHRQSYVSPLSSQLTTQRFPSFMIIGFGKAGTKAVFEALKLHPSLAGPEKELRFFSLHYKNGYNWYLSSLPSVSQGKYIIEKSPDYITDPEVPNRIIETAQSHGIDPHLLRFIVIMRDPIDRAVSEYLEWNLLRSRDGQVPLSSFHAMVVRSDGGIQGDLPFLNASCFAHHIKRWQHTFRKNQFCYVNGDLFIASPFEEMRKLESCLGLQQYFKPAQFTYNMKTHFFCFEGDKKVCLGKSKGRSHPQLPTQLIKNLRHFFELCNEDLDTILTGDT